MKDKLKNMDWEKIGFRIGQGLVITLLNTPLWVFLIGSMTGGREYAPVDKEGILIPNAPLIEIKWFAELVLKEQAILIAFTFIGIVISIIIISFLYKENRQDKRVKEQTKELKNEQRNIDKYL